MIGLLLSLLAFTLGYPWIGAAAAVVTVMAFVAEHSEAIDSLITDIKLWITQLSN